MFEVDMGINMCGDPSITAYWYHLLLRIDQGFQLRHKKLKKQQGGWWKRSYDGSISHPQY